MTKPCCPMCGQPRPSTSAVCPGCGEQVLAAIDLQGGIFRAGELLVIARDGRLPDICPLTNQPASLRVPLTREWFPPVRGWLELLGSLAIVGFMAQVLTPQLHEPTLIALSLIIAGVMLAIQFLRHSVRFEIALSPTVARSRQHWGWGLAWGWLVGLLLLGVIVLPNLPPGASGAQPNGLLLIGILLGLVVRGIDARLPSRQLLTVRRLEGDRVFLSGCHPGFLARFPEWTGGSPG